MRRVLYILALLDDSDIEWLSTVGQKQAVAAGETIIKEGVALDDLYIVLNGRFSVCIGTEKRQLAELSTGEMVGEISLIDARPPTATVAATAPSTVLRIARQAINARLESNKAFAARLYKAIAVFLAQRLRSTVTSLGYADARNLDEDVESMDEIDPDLLDTVSLAGARFNVILDRLK